MSKKRRGSSTRKKHQNRFPSTVSNTSPASPKPSPDKRVNMLHKLETMVTTNVNGKGKKLTDEEITKLKTKIANIEYSLNIVHED